MRRTGRARTTHYAAKRSERTRGRLASAGPAFPFREPALERGAVPSPSWHDDIYDICGFNGPGLLVHTSRAWRRGRELSLTIDTTTAAHLLAALATLLVAAHALGALFGRFRPRVIGEIAAVSPAIAR